MLNTSNLKKLVRSIIATRDDEIGCDDCFDELDRFVDMLLNGKNASEAMPLVQHHLDMCMDCHEEFKALLQAIQITQ